MKFRSRPSQMSFKLIVLKKFANFTGKRVKVEDSCVGVFFNKVTRP